MTPCPCPKPPARRAASQSMKTLARGAEAGITILNAAVGAADNAIARANDVINNSPLNTLVNGACAA